jgi:hypothetical protein
MAFLICTSCQRHVKDAEYTCPFCGTSVEGAARAGNPALRGARNRSRMLFGAAVAAVSGAATIVGCSSSSTPTGGTTDAGQQQKDSGGGSSEDASAAPLYGLAADSGDNMDDSGGTVALYGAAQPDSGPDDAGTD